MIEHRPRRILLVDDDPNLLVVLAEQLRDDGYDVTTARDGMEALRRLEAGWPDLILLDLMMPRIDGLALARQIKAAADLPIIVLSAIDTADSKAHLLDEVAEDYVTKPYHYPELRARIQRVLRRLGDRIPRQSLVLGPNLTIDLHRRSAQVRGDRGPADADGIAAPPRSGGQSGRGRAYRNAARPRLGGDRRGRRVLRLGLDSPAAPEDRGEPGHPSSPSHRAWRRVPPGCEPSTRKADEAGRPTDRPADRREPPAARLPPHARRASICPFRVLLTAGLIVAAVLPLAIFGGILIAAGLDSDERSVVTLLIAATVGAAFFGLLVAAFAATTLTAPLRRITAAVERVAAGEPARRSISPATTSWPVWPRATTASPPKASAATASWVRC